MGGAPALLAKTVKGHVVNAGDGMNEHPSQALLDMLTMRENFPSLQGLQVAILGDIRHSRVAKSNLFGLKKLGAEVRMFAPRTLVLTTCAFTVSASRFGAPPIGWRITIKSFFMASQDFYFFFSEKSGIRASAGAVREDGGRI